MLLLTFWFCLIRLKISFNSITDFGDKNRDNLIDLTGVVSEIHFLIYLKAKVLYHFVKLLTLYFTEILLAHLWVAQELLILINLGYNNINIVFIRQCQYAFIRALFICMRYHQGKQEWISHWTENPYFRTWGCQVSAAWKHGHYYLEW